MEPNGRPARIDYLKDRIEHCELHLRNYAENPDGFPLYFLIDIIKEEKYKCLHELRKIKEVLAVSSLRAKTSVSLFGGHELGLIDDLDFLAHLECVNRSQWIRRKIREEKMKLQDQNLNWNNLFGVK